MKNPILARLICFAMSALIMLCSCISVMATDEIESQPVMLISEEQADDEQNVLLIAELDGNEEADADLTEQSDSEPKVLIDSEPVDIASDDTEGGKKTSLEDVKEVLNALSYSDYRAALEGNASKAKDTVTYKAVDAVDYVRTVSALETKTYKNSDTGADVETLVLPDDGTVYFNVKVPSDGLYAIKAQYYTDGTDVGSSSTIERSLRIDDLLPFTEARSIEFLRYWSDDYIIDDNGNVALDENGNPAFKRDLNGNDIRLTKSQVSGKFVEKYFGDSTGYVAEPFEFYLTAGEHSIALEAVREEFCISEITICPVPDTVSYAEYKEANKSKANNASGEVYVNAEYPTATSDKSIYAINDRTSAITFPQDPSKTRLNTIGATKWQEIGQWISYDIEIPSDGFYNISLRFKQSSMEGLFTSRKLLIDGECPFEEAKTLRFNYSRKWQLDYLSDLEGNAYEFYFTAGKHTVSFEVVLGDMASILSQVSATNEHINNMYLEILMLTGSDPDAYIDYEFIKNLPEVVRGLRAESANLYSIADELTEAVGESGSNTATLQKTAYLCKKIGYDTDLIARNLDRLKSDIGTIGTWIQSVSKQPLTVDYMLITPASENRDNKYKADANVLQALGFEFKSFIMSFATDYTSIGMTVDIEDMDEDDIVEVWYAVDRDRATVIRQMIDNDFTPNTGVAINFKLVAGGSLLPSILAGVGPDVMIGLGSSDVINYAIRGAVHPLGEFDDLPEVLEQYEDAAVTPLSLYDEVYGLPMTMNFPMLFYRADVLLKLGLEIPETWDDFYNMIPAILANKLDIGYPVGEMGLYLFLFQTGESLYKDYIIENTDGTETALSGMQINLDSNTALSCFKKMCDLITLYDLPLSYSFPNRFRTGEMPVGIQDISLYNELTLFAPEISGLWGMVAVPGTEHDDGTIDYSSPVTVAATVIISNKDPEYDYSKEWEFVKWWSGFDAQSEFGTEVVSIMGDGAKYFTANTQALESLPWTKTEYNNIMYQFNELSAKPEMPGGYIITRYVTFAYQAVYNEKKDAVNEMYSYIDEINAELSRKRIEFELATIDDFTETEDGKLVPNDKGMKIAPDGRFYTVNEYNSKFAD